MKRLFLTASLLGGLLGSPCAATMINGVVTNNTKETNCDRSKYPNENKFFLPADVHSDIRYRRAQG
jgi:hypothetical protein